ncbi:MAG: general secretion pathway protein GspK [Planctomycetaceae bacterium]|nr:general secretion pathway protein GspK [Planctomycetaceae bacterium]
MLLLFIVLTIALFALLSLGLLGLSTIEHKTVVQNGQSAQLVQILQSGIDSAAKAIDQADRPNLLDNPERFCSIIVVPAALLPADFGPGRFTVFSPHIEQDQLRGIRFGLTRESAKISLETILEWETESPGQGAQALQQLPGITPTIVDSILDWLDADDVARPLGAESAWYQQRQQTYRARNAVPVALEELLLIRDVERTMLFGDDPYLAFGADLETLQRSSDSPDNFANLFTPLEPSLEPFGQPESVAATAWQFYLTPYSAEKLVNANGTVRVFLNEANLAFLESQLRLHLLDEESIQFILAWRNANGTINSPLDLLDAEVTLDSETRTSPFSCVEPVRYERFLRLLDETTTDAAVVLRGRINVNEASRLVLEAVPELTPDLVTAILNQRRLDDPSQRHTVWLLAEGIVDADLMEMLLRRLTTGGDVYRLQAIAFFEGVPMLSRAEAVLDATVKPPRTVFFKDLTPLGLPESEN